MSASVNYASTPVVGAATLTTGDSSRSAPSPANAPVIFTSASGGQVERVAITPLATTTATAARIFRYDGANFHLYAEVQIPAATVSGSAAVVTQTLEAVNYPNLFPILLPSGWSLRASINDTQTGIKVQAEGGGY